MPFYSGSRGRMYIDGSSTAAAKVQNWSFNSTMSVLDTTTLEDTDRTLVAGTRQMSGQCRLFYYDYTDGGAVKNDASDLVKRIIKKGSSTAAEQDGTADESEVVRFKLFVNNGTANGKFVEFYAYITSASMAMSVGEVLSADIAFEVSGAPSEMTL